MKDALSRIADALEKIEEHLRKPPTARANWGMATYVVGKGVVDTNGRGCFEPGFDPNSPLIEN